MLGVTTLRAHLGIRTRRANWCRTLLAGAVGVLGVVGFTPRSARAVAAPSVAVPAYFWSSTEWDRMLVSSAELRYVVLNPDSGPGTVSYPTFVTKVAATRAQGATVVGYVDTSYGVRPLAAVKADIDKYRTWYGVNAFFFDQTPYDCAQVAYYQEVEDYVRAQAGGFVFHNPGMNPQECYLDVADVVVNFEGSEASYDAWTPAPYAVSYPADRFWHIVYAVDPAHAAALLSSAVNRNGGLVFLTEQAMPNPFSVIPIDALWLAQTPTRSGRKAAPQATPPSTAPVPPPSTRVEAPQSPAPSTTAPPGAAADAPVTTLPATGVAASVTTTSTIATAGVQSGVQGAPVPVIALPVSTSVAPPTFPVPTTVALTSPPFSSPSAPVPATPNVPVADEAFTIVPPEPPEPLVVPAPVPANALALPVLPVAGPMKPGLPSTLPVAGPKVNSVVRSAVPITTRPPVGPALVPTTPIVTTGVVRVVAIRATTPRRSAEGPKKSPAVRRPSTR